MEKIIIIQLLCFTKLLYFFFKQTFTFFKSETSETISCKFLLHANIIVRWVTKIFLCIYNNFLLVKHCPFIFIIIITLQAKMMFGVPKYNHLFFSKEESLRVASLY